VIPHTPGASLVVIWKFFLSPCGAPVWLWGPVAGVGQVCYCFQTHFCDPPNPRSKPGSFLEFFLSPRGAPAWPWGLAVGWGAFAILFKRVFVVPKTPGASQASFWIFLSPHLECGDKFVHSHIHKSDLADCV
jgi:hypothetical protein